MSRFNEKPYLPQVNRESLTDDDLTRSILRAFEEALRENQPVSVTTTTPRTTSFVPSYCLYYVGNNMGFRNGPECHYPAGAGGQAYMPAGTPGAVQNNNQAQARVQPNTQPQGQGQQQQDLSKTQMPPHNFAPPQNQGSQTRPQYSNYSYRTSHANRTSTIPRQQQPFIPGATASGAAPVMYSTVLFQHAPMGLQSSYPPSRSSGYYPFVAPYIGYSPPNHTQSYYLPTTNMPANGPGRGNGGGLVGPQGPPATPNAPNTVLQHQQQGQPHLMQPMPPVVRPPVVKKSYKIPIIDPVTQQDIFSSESQNVSGESSERQTPQPEPVTNHIAEQFTKLVAEAARQPSESSNKNHGSKAVSISSPNPVPTETNVTNTHEVKSDVINAIETKAFAPEPSVGPCETPVVSAISDSPEIVPKLPATKHQKSSEPVVDTKTKQKPNKNKPVVPQEEVVVGNSAAGDALNAAAPQPQRAPRDRARSRSKDVDAEKPAPAKTPEPKPELATAVNVETTLPSHTSSEFSNIQETVKQPLIVSEDKVEVSEKRIPETAVCPSATELLSASIEKIAKVVPEAPESCSKESLEATSAIEAQAKLTQSIASCQRVNQLETKMKDIKINKTPDIETNSKVNTSDKEEVMNAMKDTVTKDVVDKSDNIDIPTKEVSHENGKEETDINSNEQEMPNDENKAPAKSAVLKYKYSEDQWSPFNTEGKKCYGLDLMKQIRDDPLSKNKPDVPLLETCKITRDLQTFLPPTRPINDALFPSFLKGTGMQRNTPRDMKKDSRNIAPNGKGSVKLTPTASSGGNPHKPMIHVSLSLREDVKLNEIENAWKPTRFKKDAPGEADAKTEELYKKFRGILNKLTPQKFDTLMEKVKNLDITTQKQLEGVIELVFEKAIDEPNFSEAYAAMCSKLSKLMVPADNPTTPDMCVNFKGLIISRCQKQFLTNTVDDQVLKMEKELADCTDPTKKKELQLLINEENRKIRMRSVGNIRFIGELYKLKMLTAKIMVFCMNDLIAHLEEEKLECLCKLLTTIGEQVENEVKDQLDNVFKRMQDIVDRKSNKISSRVRFMIQDVIELRRRKWVVKSVVDLQPKMMDQIQREAEQNQRQIELMNSSYTGGNFRRDEGGRGKRGEGRRGGQGNNNNSFMDSNWKTPRNYSVDMSKIKAVGATNKSLSNVKLAPQNLGWNHGSGTKSTTAAAPPMGSNSFLSLGTTTNNMYSVLADNPVADPATLRGNKDANRSGYLSKGASIERSTFNSASDFSSTRSMPPPVARSASGSRSAPAVEPQAAAPAASEPPPAVPQEPLPADKAKFVKSMVDLYFLLNKDEKTAYESLAADVNDKFPPQYHAALVGEILNVVLEKNSKDITLIAKAVEHLVSTNKITAENFLTGISEIFDLARDLYIDIPMLHDYFAIFCSIQIEKKHITFADLLRISENTLVPANHGHLFLRALIKNLKESMGPTFVMNKWQESGLALKQWMSEDQVSKFIEDNKFEFLEGSSANVSEQTTKTLTPIETRSKLLQLMNSDETCECIRGWVKDNLGSASSEDWFMRALIQAVCEHALFGPEGRDVPHFKQERMNKYAGLISEFGESKQAREASCLFGIQQLIHKLEHPQGLTLEIFQYLHDQYIISVEGFIAWEVSEKEPEGKAVILKALTSFFTNLKEADNEDSCSEE